MARAGRSNGAGMSARAVAALGAVVLAGVMAVGSASSVASSVSATSSTATTTSATTTSTSSATTTSSSSSSPTTSSSSSTVTASSSSSATTTSSATSSASATTSSADCTPMDLETYTITDYIRWTSTTNRLYLENGACVTITDIYESRVDNTGNKGPLYPVDESTMEIVDTVTGSWYLEADLYVTEGSKLIVQGSSKGGDCDHLLLASSAGLDGIINLRAHGGDILLEGTHVESWDMTTGTVDEDIEDGRSYISAISEVITDPTATCNGTAKNDMGEARLDIIDTEINHLGYYESESYGLTYKVRGFCTDLSNPEVFDEVAVTGDILRSNIHHMYFGHYSYGHQGGNWSYNEVHDNIGYGFDPHDDSDDLTIHNNHVYNNGWHGIIASKRCDHVSIQNNIVHDNGQITEDGQRIGNGIMLHRSSDYGIVKNNTVYNNMDSGVALYESFNSEISENDIYGNKNGIRMSLGSSDNLVFDNKMMIYGNDSKYVIYLYQGNDVPDVSDGRPTNNHFFDNTLISDDEVVYMLNSDENVIEGNVIYGRVSRFKDSFNSRWSGNFVADDIHYYKLADGSCFDPTSDIEEPEDYEYGSSSSSGVEDHSYSYDFGTTDGFFCGV